MRGDKTEIDLQAAAWAEVMDRPLQDARAAADFDRWIAADPRHLQSYAEMTALWRSGGLDTALRLSAANYPHARNDNHHGKHRRTTENGDPTQGAATARTHRLGRRTVILLSSVFLSLLAIPVAHGLFASEHVYTAPRDSDRAVLLADGSTLHLDEGARLSVRMTPWSRHVRMQTGQAYFNVAHERLRSFSVDAGGTSISVLGTAFDVDMLTGDAREVRVYRGQVSVAAGGTSWRLPAGSGLSVSDDGVQRFDNVQGERPGWIDGWFDAQDTALARLVDRISRSADRPVRLADPSLGALRVTGRFRLGDTRELLETLAAIHDLRLTEDASQYILSR